jgi:[histone H3]-lysine4 N-trimethyltransferase ATXR3
MVASGQYTIGMYAIRKIRYGEELTFDYNSVTESEKEWLSAVCLCGSSQCRTSFLSFANSSTFTDITSKYHAFLDRVYLIYKAVKNPILEPQEKALLEEHGIKSALLKGKLIV